MDEQNLLELNSYYSSVDTFLKHHRSINYIEFDYLSVLEMNLFSSIEQIDFVDLDSKLSLIIKTLPSIKRIFSRPIVHLIEKDELVPLESVRIINNDTLNYAAVHTELWDDLTKDGVKPKKLLSRKYLDNYSIYENKVFAKAIDMILPFVRKYGNMLKDLIYIGGILEVNLLDRYNHLLYYLALGKLHTGYIRSFENHKDDALRCLNKIQYILSQITPRLGKPVYTKNHLKHKNLEVRKTNILGMHKDYNKVYLLLKKFEKSSKYVETNLSEEDVFKNYFRYVKMLLIFAFGHFNFTADGREKIKFDSLDYNMSFNSYNVNIKEENSIILLTFNKDKEYKILLVPYIEDKKKVKIKANEVFYISPFKNEDIFVSINNIESFRRLQQIILKGMISSDKKRDICPFCGDSLEKVKNEYICKKCNTRIQSVKCDECSKRFVATDIYNFVKPDLEDDIPDWMREKQEEAMYHFRNITKIRDNMFICPHCMSEIKPKDITE